MRSDFLDVFVSFFFFKQKTAYEMRISDWSSDVCSSDLCEGDMEAAIVEGLAGVEVDRTGQAALDQVGGRILVDLDRSQQFGGDVGEVQRLPADARRKGVAAVEFGADEVEAADDDARSLDREMIRSEEHTSELQSLMRTSYAAI